MTLRLLTSGAAAPRSEPPATPLLPVGQDPPARARARAAASPPSLYRTVPGLAPLDQPCSKCGGTAAVFVVDEKARLVFFCEEDSPGALRPSLTGSAPTRVCRICNRQDTGGEPDELWSEDGRCSWCAAHGHDEHPEVMLGTMMVSSILFIFGAGLLAFALVVL